MTTTTYSFVFKPNSMYEFTFKSIYSLKFTLLKNIENISRIIIYKNGTMVFDGNELEGVIIVDRKDDITIRIEKNNADIGRFQLIGNI